MKKCLNMLNDDNFTKLTDDPTKSMKGKFKEQLERSKVSLVKMNAIKFIRQVLHQVNYMEQPKSTKWQEMAILITFLYKQSFQTLVQHPII